MGRLDDEITKAGLRKRFESFGPVVDVSVHFRERGYVSSLFALLYFLKIILFSSTMYDIISAIITVSSLFCITPMRTEPWSTVMTIHLYLNTIYVLEVVDPFADPSTLILVRNYIINISYIC